MENLTIEAITRFGEIVYEKPFTDRFIRAAMRRIYKRKKRAQMVCIRDENYEVKYILFPADWMSEKYPQAVVIDSTGLVARTDEEIDKVKFNSPRRPGRGGYKGKYKK